MLFKNAIIFRLDPKFTLSTDQVAEALSKHQFHPCGSQDISSMGWFFKNGEPFTQVGSNLLITLRSEKRILPTAVVNQIALERAEEIAEKQGYSVGRKQMRELKDDLIVELLPKAFTQYKDTLVWMDLDRRWIVVNAGSKGAADEVMGLMAKTFDPFPAEPIYTDRSPSSVMTEWLSTQEPVHPFTIDDQAELKSSDEKRSAVRYVNHSLHLEELPNHIAEGKQCTRLAITWDDRLSFVLTEGLELKQIKATDLLIDSLGEPDPEGDQLLGDFTLTCEELANLLPNLIEALGGEKSTLV